MTTTLIILGILTVFLLGFVQVYNHHSRVVKKIGFTSEYRNKFIEFSNKYFETYDRWSRTGNVDEHLYVWLTMNINKIQGNLGIFGIMDYIAPFQTFKVSNYQIVVNTIPKFRDNTIKDFDIHSVDDCLLRYIGYLKEQIQDSQKNLRNPIIWFREGIKQILSLPIFILRWLDIISNHTVNSIKESFVYKIISGLIALVTLISGLVTIIIGYDQTMELVKRLFIK